MIHYLRALIETVFTSFSWRHLALAVLGHYAISYYGFKFIGEEHLFAPFIYWYITTTTTIGYGDLAPLSQAGRYFVALWVMLGGVTLITATLGKLTSSAIDLWRNKMNGHSHFNHLSDHTVVVGYHPTRTDSVINLLLKDTTSNDEQIILVDNVLEENPYRHLSVGFVKAIKIDAEMLSRANIVYAERILVSGRNDDETLSIALEIADLNPKGHLVAQFDSNDRAILAKKYIPNIECTTNMSVEMIVRASQDPGTSEVINELLSLGVGETQYCQRINNKLLTTFGEFQARMKAKEDITIIAWRPEGQVKPIINPESKLFLTTGEVYYIASRRLTEKDFQSMFTD